MKKIGISLLVLTLLIGCSKKVENSERENEPELNHEEIMAGDFSSFAGVYVNSEGMIIVLDEEDIERKLMEVMCIDDGHYYLNVKTDDGFGYGIEVYGIGVEVPEYEGLTDITKIRVYRGQASPMSVEEIFNKQK